MHFAYRGFEQNNGIRRFKFSGSAEKDALSNFYFSVDLRLLSEHRVSIQETPAVCVQVLTRALSEGEVSMESCREYSLSPADLLAFTAPRRALALAHSNKKPVRLNRPKPTQASQLFTQAGPAYQG